MSHTSSSTFKKPLRPNKAQPRRDASEKPAPAWRPPHGQDLVQMADRLERPHTGPERVQRFNNKYAGFFGQASGARRQGTPARD